MFVTLVASLLMLGYVITDFIFLSDKFDQEERLDILTILKRSSFFLLSTLILTMHFFSLYYLLVITMIYILYVVIKYLKNRMHHGEKHMNKFIWFLCEHLAFILVLLSTYPLLKHMKLNELSNILFTKLVSLYPFLDVLNNINLLSYIILVIAGFLFSIRSGTRLSLIIINLPIEFKPSTKGTSISKSVIDSQQEVAAGREASIPEFSEEERMKKYGKIIGIVERIIIISAILISQFQIVLLLITIKSIGRFKEITNKTSDYYIIGNFASFSIAFFIGYTLIAAKKLLLG